MRVLPGLLASFYFLLFLAIVRPLRAAHAALYGLATHRLVRTLAHCCRSPDTAPRERHSVCAEAVELRPPCVVRVRPQTSRTAADPPVAVRHTERDVRRQAEEQPEAPTPRLDQRRCHLATTAVDIDFG